MDDARGAELIISLISNATAAAPLGAAAVIYDAPFRKEEQYEGQIETTAPAVTVLDADVTRLHLGHGSTLTLTKADQLVGTFEVIGVEPDGAGLTRLTLTKDF